MPTSVPPAVPPPVSSPVPVPAGTRRPVAGVCAVLCALASLALPAVVAAWLWHQPTAVWLAQITPAGTPATTAAAVPGAIWALVAALALLPPAAMGATFALAAPGLWQVAGGRGLQPHLARRMRRVAAAMALAALLAMAVPTAIGLLVSGAAGGPLRLSLSVNAHQVVLLLFATVVWQLAAVLADAEAVAAEHASFV